MKHHIIAIDLRTARRKAGLRQIDCAHLLGVDKSRISAIETGQSRPTAHEVAALSMIYGKPMESLLSGLLDNIVADLVDRLGTMPKGPRGRQSTFNRTHTLSQLAIRLEVISDTEHGGV